MIKIAVNGAMGRMGSRILTLAYQSSNDFSVNGAFESKGSAFLGKDAGLILGLGHESKVLISLLSGEALKGADVLIDFSSPDGTLEALELAVKTRTRIVIGTTGIEPKGVDRIQEASKKTAVLFSPNMSLGANFLFELASLSAAKLKAGYDIEIVEAHHRLKKDAPSGTAKKIAEEIAAAKSWDLSRVACYGRQGFTGERKKEEIGIHAVRAGDIVGEHTVIFSGPGETIELVHRAQSRDAFARGSLVAALFLAKKNTGLYSMKDVLQ